jgi:hypothetical protein
MFVGRLPELTYSRIASRVLATARQARSALRGVEGYA